MTDPILHEAAFLTREDLAEEFSDLLMDAGVLSVSTEDADADSPDEKPLYGEPGLEPEVQAWTRTRLKLLYEAGFDVRGAVRAAAEQLGIDTPAIESDTAVPDADWVRGTQAQFGPVKVSDRLWIVPSWNEPPVPDALNIRLDPGVAFGTGSHPTTHLCLAWLDENCPAGASVLDYGCGTGILAIAAAKVGAGLVRRRWKPPTSMPAKTTWTQSSCSPKICPKNALTSSLPTFSAILSKYWHRRSSTAPKRAARSFYRDFSRTRPTKSALATKSSGFASRFGRRTTAGFVFRVKKQLSPAFGKIPALDSMPGGAWRDSPVFFQEDFYGLRYALSLLRIRLARARQGNGGSYALKVSGLSAQFRRHVLSLEGSGRTLSGSNRRTAFPDGVFRCQTPPRRAFRHSDGSGHRSHFRNTCRPRSACTA